MLRFAGSTPIPLRTEICMSNINSIIIDYNLDPFTGNSFSHPHGCNINQIKNPFLPLIARIASPRNGRGNAAGFSKIFASTGRDLALRREVRYRWKVSGHSTQRLLAAPAAFRAGRAGGARCVNSARIAVELVARAVARIITNKIELVVASVSTEVIASRVNRKANTSSTCEKKTTHTSSRTLLEDLLTQVLLGKARKLVIQDKRIARCEPGQSNNRISKISGRTKI